MIEREKLKLAPLQGSEKQIAWAEKIRESAIKAMKASEAAPELIEEYESIDSAKWIIDHREVIIDTIYGRRNLAVAIHEKKMDDLDEIELEEYMICPQKQRGDVSPIIEAVDKTVRLKSEYDEALVNICRDREMKWDKKYWSFDYYNEEMAVNMAAELAHVLLHEGYPVRVTDEHIRELVINASYVIEVPGWVEKLDDKTLSIGWIGGKSAGAIGKDAKRITEAKWDGGRIKVPASSWREIEDFADLNNFEISDEARAVMEAWRRATITIDVPPLVSPVQQQKLKEHILDEPEIIEDLLED